MGLKERIFLIHFPAVVNIDAGSLVWRTCAHFVLLRHEYRAGLISHLAVVNPLHLQCYSQSDSFGSVSLILSNQCSQQAWFLEGCCEFDERFTFSEYANVCKVIYVLH